MSFTYAMNGLVTLGLFIFYGVAVLSSMVTRGLNL